MAKEIIVGIDLGTTNSVISYMQADGKVKVIPKPRGNKYYSICRRFQI